MDAAALSDLMENLATTLGDKLSKGSPKEVTPPKLSEVDSIKWMTFRSTFEKVDKLNKWSADRSVPMLQTCLTDAAARAVEHLVFPAGTTLEDALKKMEVIFVNPAATDYYEMQFDGADREPGESLVNLHTRYRELFLRAFPALRGDVDTQKKLKDKFALKLGDKGLSYGLTTATDYKTLTYTQLLTRAQELQASAVRCRQSYNPGTKPQVLALNAPPRRPALASSPAPQVNDRRCFFCNNLGHVVKDCRKKQAFLRDNPELRGTFRPGQTPSSRPRGRGRATRPSRGRGGRNNPSGYRFLNPKRGLNAISEAEDQPPAEDPSSPSSAATSSKEDDGAVAALYAEMEADFFPEN